MAALASDVETADASLTFSVTQPAHGTVTGVGGSRTYTPNGELRLTEPDTSGAAVAEPSTKSVSRPPPRRRVR